MTGRPERVVVGNTVAAMAAVERLAAGGASVRWLCTGAPGGAFAPRTVDGHLVGLGLRLIEREYVAGENARTVPPLDEHVPGHAGHRPWMGWVEDYLCDLVPALQPAPTPALVSGDNIAEDFTLTGRLRAITGLFDKAALSSIAEEAEACRARHVDPAGALVDPVFRYASLEAVSLANHGRSFHELVVEPLTTAFVPEGSCRIAADQRQKVWVPVYWPETLADAARGATPAFDPDRRFWVDGEGGMSRVVTALESRISTSDVAVLATGPLRSLSADGRRCRLTFEDHEEVVDDPVMATSAPELFSAMGIDHRPTRVTMSFLWVAVPEQLVLDTRATTFLDDPTGVHRITTIAPQIDPRGRRRRVFAVETRLGAEPALDDVARCLERSGLTRSCSPSLIARRSTAAFTEPTPENRMRFEAAQATASAIADLHIIGPAAGYGADPLNEQLFAGLRVAQETTHAHV